MVEWFKAPVLKTGVGASPPWVRIPPHPPLYRSRARGRSARAGHLARVALLPAPSGHGAEFKLDFSRSQEAFAEGALSKKGGRPSEIDEAPALTVSNDFYPARCLFTSQSRAGM